MGFLGRGPSAHRTVQLRSDGGCRCTLYCATVVWLVTKSDELMMYILAASAAGCQLAGCLAYASSKHAYASSRTTRY